MGKKGVYPPAIGMWVPNLTMMSIGIYFLYQTTQEKTPKIEIVLQQMLKFFSRRRHLNSTR